MLRSILVFIAFVFSVASHAQNGPLEYDRLRQVFSEDYMRTFAQEFNELQKRGDVQDIYGYFLPESQRKDFFKETAKLKITQEGAKVFVEDNGERVLEIEMVDLFTQKFKINGQLYTHDWAGKANIQEDVIKRSLSQAGKKTAGLHERAYDFLIPRADAAAPVAAAAGVVALRVCIAGGCRLALMVAERSAVYTVASTGVRMAAASATPAVRQGIMSAVRAGGRKTLDYLKYVKKNIAEDKEVVEFLTKVSPTPAKIFKAPFKATAWLIHQFQGPVVGTAVGMSGAMVATPLIQDHFKQAEKEKIPTWVAIGCIISFKSIRECKDAKPVVELGTEEVAKPTPNWCPKEIANEYQIVTSVGKDFQVLAVRVGIEGEGKGKAISGVRYMLNADRRVDPSSFRTYKMENGEVERIGRLTVDPKIATSKQFAPLVMDRTPTINEVKENIIERDKELLARTESEEVLIEGVTAIKNYAVDPLKSASDLKRKKLDQEIHAVREMDDMIKKLAPACTLLKAAEEVKPVAATTQKTEAAPASTGK